MMYRKYFQKSKVFLYPLLKIKKGVDFVPVETFLSWNGQYTIKDKKFICLYNQKTTKEWSEFENFYLLQNILFYDYVQLDKNMHLYIFDLSSFASDYNNLCKGKYSEFTELTKDIIIKFFGKKGAIAQYIKEYLYPNGYHEKYAEDLGVSIDTLQQVHELCDAPDYKKETLIYKKPDEKVIFKKKLLSLYKKSKYIL